MEGIIRQLGLKKIGTSTSKFHNIHQDSLPHSLTLLDFYVSEFPYQNSSIFTYLFLSFLYLYILYLKVSYKNETYLIHIIYKTSLLKYKLIQILVRQFHVSLLA